MIAGSTNEVEGNVCLLLQLLLLFKRKKEGMSMFVYPNFYKKVKSPCW
jgi:hypothetical protein